MIVMSSVLNGGDTSGMPTPLVLNQKRIDILPDVGEVKAKFARACAK